MKANDKILKNLLITTDALNIINGGISMFATDLSKNSEGYCLSVKAPGISSESLGVEIKDNNLYVYYIVNLSRHKDKAVPSYLIKAMSIPFDVDILKIHAAYENNVLQVMLPFNELSHGYHKNVEIYHS